MHCELLLLLLQILHHTSHTLELHCFPVFFFFFLRTFALFYCCFRSVFVCFCCVFVVVMSAPSIDWTAKPGKTTAEATVAPASSTNSIKKATLAPNSKYDAIVLDIEGTTTPICKYYALLFAVIIACSAAIQWFTWYFSLTGIFHLLCLLCLYCAHLLFCFFQLL